MELQVSHARVSKIQKYKDFMNTHLLIRKHVITIVDEWILETPSLHKPVAINMSMIGVSGFCSRMKFEASFFQCGHVDFLVYFTSSNSLTKRLKYPYLIPTQILFFKKKRPQTSIPSPTGAPSLSHTCTV